MRDKQLVRFYGFFSAAAPASVRQRPLEAGDQAAPRFRIAEGFRLCSREQFPALARRRKARLARGDLRAVAELAGAGQRIHRIEGGVGDRQERRQGLRVAAFDEIADGAIFAEPQRRQWIKPESLGKKVSAGREIAPIGL